ncbi:MAG TPA: Hsp70 family protein [Myxococcales bacterium]
MSDPVVQRFGVSSPDEETFLAGLGAHVARGGLFVPGPNPLPEGTRVSFEFTLQDLTTVFACEGVVVLSRRPGGTGRAGMLVRFTSLLAEDVLRVERASATPDGTQDAPLPSSATAPGEPADPLHPPGTARRSRPSGPELCIGIDFGATSCRAGVLADRGVRALELEGRSPVLPSAVAVDDRGRLMLGTRARAQQAVDPRSALVGFRRLLGLRPSSDLARKLTERLPYEVCTDAFGEGAVRVRGRVMPIVETAAYLLAEIRNRASNALGQPVRHAVLSAPAAFTDRQRQALRLAAHLAGWKVDHVVSDPIAATVAWCHRRGLGPRLLLVFDLGGSSFAASLVRVTAEQIEVLGTDSEPQLGGEAFDHRLARFLEEAFARAHGTFIEDPLTRHRVRDAAEAAKISLSREDPAVVHVPWAAADVQGKPLDLHSLVTRAQFDPLVADLASRAVVVARALCQRFGVGASQLEEVILVGGQSEAPVVRLALEAAFGDKVGRELAPTEAVYTGTAIVGWAQRQEPRRSGPAAAAALSRGIHLGLSDGRYHRVLERGQSLPCERACQVVVGPQGMVRLAAWQEEPATERHYLGALYLRAPAGETVEAVFSVSRSGVLTLTGRTAKGGAILTAPTANLTEEGRRELEACAALPEPTGLETVDAKRLLAR